ncbi:hypothetical protein S83_013102 [Arachis hypogaea]
MALSLAEARLQVAIESLEAAKEERDSAQGSNESNDENDIIEKEKALLVAQEDIKECQTNLANSEVELKRLQNRKEELQTEVSKLHEIAEKAQLDAVKAEEDVTNLLPLNLRLHNVVERDEGLPIDDESLLGALSSETISDKTSQLLEEITQSDYLSDNENAVQTRKQEMQKDFTRDSSSLAPKALLKKSSRSFSASSSLLLKKMEPSSHQHQFSRALCYLQRSSCPSWVLGLLFMGAGVAFYANRGERTAQLLQQPEVIVTSVKEASSNAKPLVKQLKKLPKKNKGNYCIVTSARGLFSNLFFHH